MKAGEKRGVISNENNLAGENSMALISMFGIVMSGSSVARRPVNVEIS